MARTTRAKIRTVHGEGERIARDLGEPKDGDFAFVFGRDQAKGTKGTQTGARVGLYGGEGGGEHGGAHMRIEVLL